MANLETAIAPSDTPRAGAGTASSLNRLWEYNTRNRIADRIRAWERVRNRFGRKTVNIGVSGQMKTGKSTLLKTISGLSDQQIPTGDYETTAVRSRIYHDQKSSALVTFHTWESFREKILSPLYEILVQRPPPKTISDFENERLRIPNTESVAARSADTNLKNIRESTASYKALLMNGGSREIPMEDIRAYVALPGPGEKNPPRLYLAVSDCQLRTPFPNNTVSELGLIDLPGLGSNIKDVDRHHLEGVQNDIDVALMVKRAVEHSGFQQWNAADNQALKQLEIAADGVGIKNPGEFILLLINGSAPPVIALDRTIIDEAVNSQKEVYRILAADARNQDDVTENVLNPVLEHLAAKLGSMDGNLLSHALEQDRKEIDSLRSALDALIAQIQSAGMPPTVDKLVVDLARDLRDNLAKGVLKIADKYEYSAGKDVKSEWQQRFAAELKKLSDDLENNWTKSYFNSTWANRVAGKLAVAERHVPSVAPEEMRACRAALRHQFSRLDAVFRVEIESMWEELADALRCCTGKLLPTDLKAEQTIRRFKELCENSGCQSLMRACDAVLATNISLRLNFMQCIAEGMRFLDPARVSQGQPKRADQVKAGEDPTKRADQMKIGEDPVKLAEEFRKHLCACAALAIEKTSEAIEKRAQDVDQILYAIVEHGNDLFIRWPEIQTEYQELVRAYGCEIDSSTFDQVANNDKTYKKRAEAIKAVRSALSALGN
jgi:hypothetical protein